MTEVVIKVADGLEDDCGVQVPILSYLHADPD